MARIMTNDEFIFELVQLKNQCPKYPIKFFSNSDEMVEEYNYFTLQKISKIVISFFATYSDKFYLDEDELRTDIENDIYGIHLEPLTDDEWETIIDKEVKKCNPQLIIAVYLEGEGLE